MRTQATTSTAVFRFFRKLIPGVLLSAAVLSASAQLQTAGTVFVNLDVTTVPVGPVTDITNTGTLGGYFEARTTNNISANGAVVVSSNNVPGFNLGANLLMQLRSSNNGPLIPPPSGIVGNNATASIEVWALNPSVAADESMVAWGRRGFAGQNMSFGYGSDANLGAVTHGTSPDLAWDPVGGAPLNGVWHHLVYTYNGTNESIYVDGALANSKTGLINTATNAGIMLGAQWTNVAGVDIVTTNPAASTLVIGRVRIHDGALTAAQVFNNYTVEKSTFQPAPLVPQYLTASPVHRYSFNEPDTNNAIGLAIHDSIGSADGVVRGTNVQTTPLFARGRLILPASETATNAGPQMRAAYGDLPNGLVSVNSTNNGGTGEVSIEVWYKNTGGIAAGRVFDIGSCGLATNSVGVEVPDIAGRPIGDSALDYLFYSSTVGGALNQRRLGWQNKDTLPAGTTTNSAAVTADAFMINTHQTDRHLVVTWKELDTNSLVIAYENGQRVASLSISNSIASLNDVNVWLGRSMLTDPEFAGEFDEVRFYTNVLTPEQVVGDFQAGPNTLNFAEQAAAVITQPQSATVFQGSPASFYVLASGSPGVSYQWTLNGTNVLNATNSTLSVSAATLPAGASPDVYACVIGNVTSTATNSVASSGATLTVVPNQAPPAQFLHETRDGNRDNYNLPSAEVGGLFKSGANSVMVTHLGYYDLNNDGLVKDHRVGIFNAGGTNLLVSVTVPAGTGSYLTNGYRWVALNPPFLMAANTTYILEGETFSSSGDGWPDVFAPGSWNPYFVGSNDGTTRTGRFNGSVGFGGNPTSASTVNGTYAAPNLASIPIGPAIAYMPQTAVTNYSGASLSIPAFVNGDAPVTVQWYKAPDTLLTGQTNSTLFFPALTLADAGDYYIIANNASSAQSDNVTLTVLPGVPVTIAQPPVDTTVPEGYDASFTVVAAGTPPFTYQWSQNGTPILGATTDTLTIPAVTLALNGSTYFCAVSNIADSVAYSATSSAATLTVAPNKALPPQFLHEQHDGNRDDYTGNVGGSFQVGSTDALVTHLGYYDYNGDGLVRDHHVGIFNAAGTLLTQVDVPAGTDPFLTNGYRWVPLSSFFVLTNNTTYYIGAEVFANDGDAWPDVFAPQNWNPYFVGANPGSTRLSHFGGGAWPVNPLSGSGANSRYAAGSLAVLPIGAPSATIQPTNILAYAGDSATFSALVNGQAPLTVQWYKDPGILLTGQTNTTLTLTGLATGDSGDYYLMGNNSISSSPSAFAHLTVLDLTAPIVSQQPQAVTVDLGQRAIFSASAVGQQPVTNQWYFQGNPIPGATNTTLIVLHTSASNVGDYTVLFGNALGTTNSDPAHLIVLAPQDNPYAAAIVKSAPLIYYRFSDAGSSTAYNLGSLGASHNGLYEGTVSLADGPRPPDFPEMDATNESTFFDRDGFGQASGDIAIPALNIDTTAGAHCTLAAWIYSVGGQAPYAGIIFNRGANGANGLGVKTNGLGTDVLEYHWNNTNYTFDTGLAVPAGQWVYVALVIAPAKATFYLYNNGTLQTATNIIAHAPVPFADTTYVGWDSTGPSARRFYGMIDEPVIFDKSLTAADVTALYNASFFQNVTLTGYVSGGNVILNWNAGVLQRSTNVAGPFLDDNTAASPYTISTTNKFEFYRVRVQ